MSIKITKDDYTIEVNTEEELKAVLNALGIKRQTVSLNPRDFIVDTNVLLTVYESIPPYTKAYEALRLLKEKPDGYEKYELIKKLGLDNPQALGGVFGGMSKHAREHGLSVDDIYKYEYSYGKETYRLTDDMLKAIGTEVKTNGE